MMSHAEAMPAGRAVSLVSALTAILGMSPMVVSARRAITKSSAEVAEGDLLAGGGLMTRAHPMSSWEGRLLVSIENKSIGHWRNPADAILYPGALLLSDHGLYVYKGEDPPVSSTLSCKRPPKGFDRMKQGLRNLPASEKPCSSSIFFDLHTMRTLDEGHMKVPDDLLSSSEGLIHGRWFSPFADYGVAQCFGIQGCSDEACHDRMSSLKVCSPDIRVLKGARRDVDEAIMDSINQTARFPSEVAHAVHAALLVDPTMGGKHLPEFSFSPYAVPGNEIAAQELLGTVADSFSKGVIEHAPGKNSRSGAVFFFSQDKNFIAKRIRDQEMQALWKLSRDRSLAYRIETGSVLSPIYLAFVSKRVSETTEVRPNDADEDVIIHECWIISKTERLVPEVDTLLSGFDRVEKFFYDVKPEPMESDRVKALQEFAVENKRDGFEGSSLPGWRNILSNVSKEVRYLDSHKIVDYSAFMYGAHFDVLGAGDYADKLERMKSLVTPQIGCEFGCRDSLALPDKPRADRHFIDVTSRLSDRAGGIHVDNAAGLADIYTCCCLAFSPGTSDSIYSPCVLVNLKTPRRFPLPLFGPHNMSLECSSWLTDEWEWYKAEQQLPVTDGKCLVSYEGQPWGPKEQPPERLRMLADKGYLLKPGPALNLQPAPPLIAKCDLVCVSLADYLLEFDFYKRFENALLLPFYGSRKWTNYDQKFNALIDCFSRPGMPDCESFDETEQRAIDINVIGRLRD